MNIAVVILLAVIQGAAELLPVSSSAHVIVAERLLHLDPTSPEMTFLLVMLHTGTMGAVTVYFWSRWRERLQDGGRNFIQMVVVATVATGLLGLLLKKIIEHMVHGDVESLFGNLTLVAVSLLAAGILIIATGSKDVEGGVDRLEMKSATWIGLVQGLCLPFRGFSRSGATISVGLAQGLRRSLAEDFSFSLAVVLTPPVIFIEAHRLLKSQGAHDLHLAQLFGPGLLGMLVSFAAGLFALRLLSSALEQGRWKFFGYYCVTASAVVYAVSRQLG